MKAEVYDRYSSGDFYVRIKTKDDSWYITSFLGFGAAQRAADKFNRLLAAHDAEVTAGYKEDAKRLVAANTRLADEVFKLQERNIKLRQERDEACGGLFTVNPSAKVVSAPNSNGPDTMITIGEASDRLRGQKTIIENLAKGVQTTRVLDARIRVLESQLADAESSRAALSSLAEGRLNCANAWLEKYYALRSDMRQVIEKAGLVVREKWQE